MTIKLYDVDGKLIDKLYQWDCNRYITLSMGDAVELSEADQIYFHFSNSHTEEAYSVKAIKTGDRDYEVMIPNELFMYDDTIFMYIFRDAGEDGRITIGEVKLPLIARSMPSDYVLKDSPGVIRIANGLVAVDNIVYLARDGVPFGEGAEAAPDVGFGAAGDSTSILDGFNLGIVGAADYDAVVVDLLQEPYLSSLVNGYCNDDTGVVVTPYNTRVCCTEFVEIPDDVTRFSVDVNISGSPARAYEYIYDENGAYLKSVTSGTDPLTGAAHWTHQASGAIREVPLAGKKMRILCRTSSGGNISPSDVGLFKVTFW